MTRAMLFLLLRILVAVLLCIWLVLQASWAEFSEAMANVAMLPLIAAVLGRLCCFGIVARRLQMFLATAAQYLSFRHVLELTFVGSFVGNFLPGTYGGDALKAVLFKQMGLNYTSSLPLLLADRASNLSGVLILFLSVLAVPELVTLLKVRPPDSGTGIAVMAGVAIIAGLVWLALRQRPALVDNLFRGAATSWATLRHLARAPRILGIGLILSLLSESISFATVYLLADSIGISVSFLEIVAVLAMVQVIVLMPVTMNGFGLQEASIVLLLGVLGVEAPAAVTLAVLVRLISVLTTLPGLLYLLLGRSGWLARHSPR